MRKRRSLTWTFAWLGIVAGILLAVAAFVGAARALGVTLWLSLAGLWLAAVGIIVLALERRTRPNSKDD